MSRRRHVSDEEDALWQSVARSVKPLRKTGATGKLEKSGADASDRPRAAVKDRLRPAAPSRPVGRSEKPASSAPLPLVPLDRRLKQRVARGRHAIAARLDLHGMTQSEAHAALADFLRRAQAEGAAMVLVVTGKGSGNAGHAGGERGVLRRQVPLWLALPEFRRFVVGFDEAHVGHGGAGALYVRLRRAR